ncbi:MAG: hypothetical protein KQJ78_01245 [Deltaproteobacteria bacterium]|nr:hypothetical protein [Deltaproteobacteria bacterium]
MRTSFAKSPFFRAVLLPVTMFLACLLVCCLASPTRAEEAAGREHTRVVSLAVLPAGGAVAASDQPGVILFSPSGAGPWDQLPLPDPQTYVYQLQVDGAGHLWAATSAGLLASSDAGRAWRVVLPASTRLFAPDSAGGGWALTWAGQLWRVGGDGGQPAAVPGELPSPRLTALAGGPDGTLWAGSFGQGVFQSRDQGRTWTPASQGLGSLAVLGLVRDAAGVLWAGTWPRGLWRRGEADAAWQSAGPPLAENLVTALAAGEGLLLAGTQASGVFLSRDGGKTFAPGPERAQGAPVQALALGPGGLVLAGTWGDGAWRSPDHGAAWARTYLAEGARALALDADGVLWAGTEAGRLFTSADQGRTWQLVPPCPALEDQALAAVAPAPEGRVYVATPDQGVFASADGGKTFAPLGQDPPRETASLCLDAAGGLWAASCQGGLFHLPGSGAWQIVDFALTSKCAWRVFPGASGALWACTARGLLHSPDQGRTWAESPPALRWGLTDLARAPERWIAVADRMFFASGDQGQTWNELATEHKLPRGQHYRALALPPGGPLFAAADYGGVLIFDLAGPDRLAFRGEALAGQRKVFALLPLPEGGALAATSQGLFRSDPRGAAWTKLRLAD